MKAILKYGQFTSMIELPDTRPMISILKPQDSISFMPIIETDLSILKTTRLDFRMIRQLDADTLLYEFDCEV